MIKNILNDLIGKNSTRNLCIKNKFEAQAIYTNIISIVWDLATRPNADDSLVKNTKKAHDNKKNSMIYIYIYPMIW